MTRNTMPAVLCVATALLLFAAADARGGAPYSGTLWAARSTDAGTYSLGVAADCSELTVQLVPENGWELAEFHVDLVSDPANFPTNRPGNPQVGRFQWRASFPPTTAPLAFTVRPEHVIDPISCGATIYAAIHAAVVLRDDSGAIIAEETAWGGPYGRGSQAWNPNGFLPDEFYEFPGPRWDYYLELVWEGAPIPPSPTPTPTPTFPPPTPTPQPPTPTPTPFLPTPTPTPQPPTPTATPVLPTPTPTPQAPAPTPTPT